MPQAEQPLMRTPAVTLDLPSWTLEGSAVTRSEKRLRDLPGIFADEEARRRMDPGTLVYTVQAYTPVGEGVPGGLFFGNTTIRPGKVGAEYFMTRGHRHARTAAAEYYWGVSGEGVLLFMDTRRSAWAERVFPGSLHYVSGDLAHRLINTGPAPLTIGACWYSDAGHDYESIDRSGFPVRLLEVRGAPALVESR